MAPRDLSRQISPLKRLLPVVPSRWPQADDEAGIRATDEAGSGVQARIRGRHVPRIVSRRTAGLTALRWPLGILAVRPLGAELPIPTLDDDLAEGVSPRDGGTLRMAWALLSILSTEWIAHAAVLYRKVRTSPSQFPPSQTFGEDVIHCLLAVSSGLSSHSPTSRIDSRIARSRRGPTAQMPDSRHHVDATPPDWEPGSPRTSGARERSVHHSPSPETRGSGSTDLV